jgi:hypothetical protein
VAVRGGQRAKCTLLHGHVLHDLLRNDCHGSSGWCLVRDAGEFEGPKKKIIRRTGAKGPAGVLPRRNTGKARTSSFLEIVRLI